jgi:hypothetical protein
VRHYVKESPEDQLMGPPICRLWLSGGFRRHAVVVTAERTSVDLR